MLSHILSYSCTYICGRNQWLKTVPDLKFLAPPLAEPLVFNDNCSMGKSQQVQHGLNVVADYEAEVPAGSLTWIDEPLDAGWLQRFEAYLNSHNGAAAWRSISAFGSIRDVAERIHRLTDGLSVDRAVGTGFAVEDKRQLHSLLKKNLSKAGSLLVRIEALANPKQVGERNEEEGADKVLAVEDRTNPVDWPAERHELIDWIARGKGLLSRLEEHFRSISHAKRDEMNDEGFLMLVLLLRDRYGCSYPKIAVLIAAGIAAGGWTRKAEEFDHEKVKDGLRRRKKSLPDLYASIERDIQEQVLRTRHSL